MINFRYHLASLVAVFLALGLGVVMGSTVVDRAVVDGLRNRIDQVESNAEKRRSENEDLRRQVAERDAFIEEANSFTVERRLAGVPIVVVAVNGVDESPVKAAVTELRASGANVPGILWLEPKWGLTTADATRELAAAIGQPVRPEAQLRDAAWFAFARRIVGGTPATSGQLTDVLVALLDAKFLRFDPVGTGTSLPQSLGARALLVGGSEQDVAVDGMLVSVARQFVIASLPTTAAEVYVESDKGPDRGSVVGEVRDDAALSRVVSTIDDLDIDRGRVAAVLALRDLSAGVVGHYGIGEDASDGQLPAWNAR